MSVPISIVIPTLADRELLASCLEALSLEIEERALGDEIVVVDDSGGAQLSAWVEAQYPRIVYLANEENLGFARSLTAGVEGATHGLILSLNPDVRVRRGCLAPLIETLGLPDVRAAAPYVLLNGERGSDESLPELVFEEGFPRIRCLDVEVTPGESCASHPEGVPVAFALGGAFLFRREEFLASPFDSRFEPFYWEDVDWCQDALQAGHKILVDPRSVVEHHHRGTISARVPEAMVRAAIEKNRLLFTWKRVRSAEQRREHFQALVDRLLEHGIAEDREQLIWLCLALEQVQCG